LRVAILGLGSIGGIFLSSLVDSSADIIVVCRGIKSQLISNDGIILYAPEGTIDTIPADMFTLIDSELGPIPRTMRKSCDVAIICGKANSTTILAEMAYELLSDAGIVMSIQNGLGNSEYLCKKFGQRRVLGSTVTHGAWHSQNSFHWEGRGVVKMGNLEGGAPSKQESEFFKLLDNSNLSPIWSEDINKEIWIKLLINIAINPLCAITGLNNGAIKSIPLMWDQAVASMSEASQIATASGINISDVNFENLLDEIVTSTANNRCSMLQDIMANKPTEIETLCGEIVKRGESFGIPTPLNSMLLTLIEGIENSSNFE